MRLILTDFDSYNFIIIFPFKFPVSCARYQTSVYRLSDDCNQVLPSKKFSSYI